MRVVLEITTGPHRGRKITLRPGERMKVGRASWTDLSVPDDSELAVEHFAIERGAKTCRVSNLNSRYATLVNGRKVDQATVGVGDSLHAGQTTFVLTSDTATVDPAVAPPAAPPVAATPAAPPPAAAPPSRLPPDSLRGSKPQDLLAFLQRQSEPLFALLDGARDLQVWLLLQDGPVQHQSLYEGPDAEGFGECAPFLVALPHRSAFLETLLRQGWGQSWGVFLTCPESFEQVRKHLRRFLLVKIPDGREVYFRYYDPRVLRVFLPTCTPTESAEFFGPIRSYLLEAKEKSRLLKFGHGPQGISQEIIPVSLPELSAAHQLERASAR
jgi:hypothetical protein